MRGVLALALVVAACEPSARGQAPVQVAVARAAPDASTTAAPVPERVSPEAAARARQMRWLRATWPKQTRELSFDSLAPRLLEWVPPGGEVEAFLTLPEAACSRIVLDRRDGDDAVLGGKLITDESKTDAGLVRSYRAASLGHWLHLETGGGSETFDGKTWVESSGWGVGDGGTTLDVLSHVDADVARWEGTAVRITAHCAGPFEPLACADGGSRPCDTCKHVSLDVTAYNPGSWMGMGYGRGRLRVAAACNEPCPKVGNPDIDRVAKLDLEHAWRPLEAEERRDVVPSLYRSEARCRRESR